MLKWLREHDCPWDTDTIWQAAEAGHADVLQWALDNGCADGDSELRTAIFGDSDSDSELVDSEQDGEAE